MKLGFLALFAVLFFCCSALHFVEPAAAVSDKKVILIDEYTYSSESPENEFVPPEKWQYAKYTLKTYKYNGNLLKTIVAQYTKKGQGEWKVFSKDVFVFKRTSKQKIKVSHTEDLSDAHYSDVSFKKTKLSVTNYYWKVFRPNYLESMNY
jgi:hypothetical protein